MRGGYNVKCIMRDALALHHTSYIIHFTLLVSLSRLFDGAWISVLENKEFKCVETANVLRRFSLQPI